MPDDTGVEKGMQNNKQAEDDFFMSPKLDFVFKLIFGDEKNKELLIALLSTIIQMPLEAFEGIEIINSELLRIFKEDKKGILDVRVKTPQGNKRFSSRSQKDYKLFMIYNTIKHLLESKKKEWDIWKFEVGSLNS